MQKIIVSASSLPAGRNMSAQIEYVQRVNNYGADMYHLDVMDGEFVKYKSIDYTYFEQIKSCSTLLLETHLMVKNPNKCIKKYIKTPVSIIVVHYEAFKDESQLLKLIAKIKKANKMAGVAIDKDTDVNVLNTILDKIDLVLVMTVKAGKGGQVFDEACIDKIQHIRALNSEILIEVDGGINADTGAKCVKAGADILVAGNFIYNNEAYDAIEKLHNCVK